MNIIGAFTRTGETFEGEVITLSVQSTNVRILPNPEAGEADAPSHIVCVGRAMVGQGWPAEPASGALLSLVLDDPSFVGPIRVLLLPTEQSDGFSLIWHRPV